MIMRSLHKSHLRREGRISCSLCPATFHTAEAVATHERSAHGKIVKVFGKKTRAITPPESLGTIGDLLKARLK